MIIVTQDGSLRYFASHRDSQNCKQAQKKLQQKLQEKINEEEIHKMLTEVTGQSSNPSSRSFSDASLSGCPYYIMIASALTAFFNGTIIVSNVDSTLLSGISEESLSSSSSIMTPTAESGLTTPTGGAYPRATSPDHGSVYSDKETESLAASIASMNLSSLYLSQSEDGDGSSDEEKSFNEEKTPKCRGVTVDWKPGSIWNTYPYHQHTEWDMDWAPIGTEDNRSLQLCSKNCSINLNSGDAAVLTCSSCQYIPNSVKFKKFMSMRSLIQMASKKSLTHQRLIRENGLNQ